MLGDRIMVNQWLANGQNKALGMYIERAWWLRPCPEAYTALTAILAARRTRICICMVDHKAKTTMWLFWSQGKRSLLEAWPTKSYHVVRRAPGRAELSRSMASHMAKPSPRSEQGVHGFIEAWLSKIPKSLCTQSNCVSYVLS